MNEDNTNTFNVDKDDDNDDFHVDELSDKKSSKSTGWYVNDFAELKIVGRGGGGTVFKV